MLKPWPSTFYLMSMLPSPVAGPPAVWGGARGMPPSPAGPTPRREWLLADAEAVLSLK